jgi:hypothetical protein
LSGGIESGDMRADIGAPLVSIDACGLASITGSIMADDIEQRIRERAYHMWLSSGGVDGNADRHWLAAEREVLAAFAASAPPPKPDSHSATKKVAAAPRATTRAAGGARRRAS